MKMKLLLFLFIFMAEGLMAQVVTLYPSFASESDSIKIVFNAKEATQKDLVSYTGDVYAHTGVTTSAGQWQHVIGTWADNSTQPKLTRIGTDLYELKIGYPHQFYKAGASEKILQLDFVFRNAEASINKKQTEDIHIKLYDSGLNVTILSPAQFPVFASQGDTVKVKATASKTSAKKLYINNILTSQTGNDTLNYNIIVSEPGRKLVKITADDGQGNVRADSFYYYGNPAKSVKELPAGVKDGINYKDASSATLVLYAPGKKFVYVVGDFNNWETDAAYFMNSTPDGNRFWVTIPNLTSGQEYAFQYYVDGQIKVADPYTDKVLDPWNDKYIPSSVYPNLKAYPVDKTDNIVSVLQTGQTPFSWVNGSFKRPDKANLVIYELLVRDFVSTHSYKTLKDTLSYLKRLGINAIELMPVSEFEGNDSWGYNPNFYFAPDKYYGTKDDLKRFVDECHSSGIAVIMDIVLNHSYGTSPLVRLYWDSAKNRPAADNPWFNVTSPNTTYSWGSDFNHESQATKDFVDRVTSYWITEFKIDGYRFDFTKGFTNTPGDGSAYDASRIAILKRMADKIWGVDSTAYVILEHFAANNEEKELTDYGMMVWGNLNYNYNEATMGYNTNSDLSWGSYQKRGWTKPGLVTYMESHDEERLMFKNEKYGNRNGSYSVLDTSQALNRIKLASALFFTVPGPKMIWQFEELGYDYSIDYNGRVGSKPIRWDYMQQPRREKLYKVMQALIKLKTSYEAFRSNNYSIYLQDSVKKISISHPSMNVAVIGNFGVTKFSSDIYFPGSGTYYDYFSGSSITVTNPQVSIMLEPGEFHVYTSVKLPLPESGILNGVKGGNQEVKDFTLMQNYPNPFNPSTLITYELPRSAKVTLKVYDILGKQVALLADGYETAGSHSVEFSGKNLSSGMYIYELRAGESRMTKKMTLLK
ncbi:MAG: alpha-amylase family glycosyl hydrolase [Ignavibacteriales bacterium]